MWSRAVSTRRICAVVVALALFGVLPQARAQATLTAEAFVGRLEAALASAETGLTAPSPALMDGLRAGLGLPADVTFPAGTIRIEPDPVLNSLVGNAPEGFALARARLDALIRSARDAARTAPADDAAIRRALARSYHGVESTPGWLDRLQAWLGERLARVLGNLDSLSLSGVVTWIVVIGLAVGLFFILRRLRLVPQKQIRRTRGSRDVERPDWDALADAAVARGDHREAVRCRFRALVTALDEGGFVRESPSLTAAECRQAVVKKRPEAQQAVDHATRIFERAHYGHAAVAPEDVESVRLGELAVRS